MAVRREPRRLEAEDGAEVLAEYLALVGCRQVGMDYLAKLPGLTEHRVVGAEDDVLGAGHAHKVFNRAAHVPGTGHLNHDVWEIADDGCEVGCS